MANLSKGNLIIARWVDDSLTDSPCMWHITYILHRKCPANRNGPWDSLVFCPVLNAPTWDHDEPYEKAFPRSSSGSTIGSFLPQFERLASLDITHPWSLWAQPTVQIRGSRMFILVPGALSIVPFCILHAVWTVLAWHHVLTKVPGSPGSLLAVRSKASINSLVEKLSLQSRFSFSCTTWKMTIELPCTLNVR